MGVNSISTDSLASGSSVLTAKSSWQSTASEPVTTASDADIQTAMATLSAHLASNNTEPRMTVDYLSGLNVVTFTAKDTGAVVYQMPSVDAVRLARLIGEGGDIQSLGLLEKSA